MDRIRALSHPFAAATGALRFPARSLAAAACA
jgi:hypothetical protein